MSRHTCSSKKSTFLIRCCFQAAAILCLAFFGSNQIQAQITFGDIHAKYAANNKRLFSKPVVIRWTKTESVTPEYVKMITPQIDKIKALKKSLGSEKAMGRAEMYLRSYSHYLRQFQESEFRNYIIQSCDKGSVFGFSRDRDAFFDSQIQLAATNQDFEMNVFVLPRDRNMYGGLGYFDIQKTDTIEFASSTVRPRKQRLGVGIIDGIVAELGPGLESFSDTFFSWTELVFPDDFDIGNFTDISITQNKNQASVIFYTPVSKVGMKIGNRVSAEFDLSRGALPMKICRTRFVEKDGKRFDAFAKSFATEEYTFKIGEHEGAFYIKQATFSRWYPTSQNSWDTVRSQIVDDAFWQNHLIEIARTPHKTNAEKIKMQSIEIKTLEVSAWKPKDTERLFSMDKLPQSERTHIDFREYYPDKQ